MIQSHIHQRHDMHLWSKNSEETIHHVSQIPTASKKHLDPFLQAIFGLEDSQGSTSNQQTPQHRVASQKWGRYLRKAARGGENDGFVPTHSNATPPPKMACLTFFGGSWWFIPGFPMSAEIYQECEEMDVGNPTHSNGTFPPFLPKWYFHIDRICCEIITRRENTNLHVRSIFQPAMLVYQTIWIKTITQILKPCGKWMD